MEDIYYMKKALAKARIAGKKDEIPVGAVIVKNGVIIATGYNKKETKTNPLLHAEIDVIQKACKKLNTWRLVDCTLYVTLEPCPMCAGAIINSRLKRVVFGCFDKKSGALGSVFDINSLPFNHKFEVTGGILEEENSKLLSDYFADLRNRKSKRSL